MGKYLTKCGKGAGEMAVMEVTQVGGVTTRARALAIASAAAADAAAAAAVPKRRKAEVAPAPSELVQTSSYIQLRSRRLVMTGRGEDLPPRNSPNSAFSSATTEKDGEILESSNCNGIDSARRARREAKHSSAERLEAGYLESTARVTTTSTITTPPTAEIEEFFSAAERDQALRFADKYNYDVINDVPLNGRFRWVPIDL